MPLSPQRLTYDYEQLQRECDDKLLGELFNHIDHALITNFNSNNTTVKIPLGLFSPIQKHIQAKIIESYTNAGWNRVNFSYAKYNLILNLSVTSKEDLKQETLS